MAKLLADSDHDGDVGCSWTGVLSSGGIGVVHYNSPSYKKPLKDLSDLLVFSDYFLYSQALKSISPPANLSLFLYSSLLSPSFFRQSKTQVIA